MSAVMEGPAAPAAPAGLAVDASVKTFLRPFREEMDDPAVTEIAVNDVGRVWYERDSKWYQRGSELVTSQAIEHLGTAVATLSHQKWDRQGPLLSASLPGGERIQLVKPPSVESGRLSFTLRKPARTARSVDDFAASGLFNKIRPMQNTLLPHELQLQQLLADRNYENFMRLAVRSRMNIVVAGATGSGKTTFMKGLVKEIPRQERLITTNTPGKWPTRRWQRRRSRPASSWRCCRASARPAFCCNCC